MAARRVGELAMTLVRHDIRPSQIVTRKAIENAIASVAATGGSTNGVLHLLALAHEFGIELEIDEFGPIADRPATAITGIAKAKDLVHRGLTIGYSAGADHELKTRFHPHSA